MKRSILAIILCLFLFALPGCSIGKGLSVSNENRDYISLTYLQANTDYKTPEEAKSFLKNHKNQYVKWTVPVKSVLNNEYLILQAKNLCQVYAQFNDDISKSGKFSSGDYVTVSGSLDSYCRSLLGVAPYWTLKNCRIESTDTSGEEDLKDYLATASDSIQNGTEDTQTTQKDDSSTVTSATVQSAALDISVSDFKTQLLAKDKNFAEMPSFKDGGNETLGDYYYTYETDDSKAKYEVFLNVDSDKINSVQLEQNAVASDSEKLRAQTVYNDVLYVVYGSKENDNYKTASEFVKNFITRNTRFNDFHVASTTVGNYKISLEIRSKTQIFRMNIEPKQ